MGYFQNINSLAELKKSYRVLALQNHPDKGGSTETMQQINLEFGRLYAKWKDDMTVSAAASGYENDYAGASANEYTEYVYNEYRWKGRNYNGQMRGKSWRLSANGSRRPIRGINSPSRRTVTVPSTSIWSKRISRPSRKSPVLSIKISTIITLEQTGPLRNGHARSCSTSVTLPCRTTTTTATS